MYQKPQDSHPSIEIYTNSVPCHSQTLFLTQPLGLSFASHFFWPPCRLGAGQFIIYINVDPTTLTITRPMSGIESGTTIVQGSLCNGCTRLYIHCSLRAQKTHLCPLPPAFSIPVPQINLHTRALVQQKLGGYTLKGGKHEHVFNGRILFCHKKNFPHPKNSFSLDPFVSLYGPVAKMLATVYFEQNVYFSCIIT